MQDAARYEKGLSFKEKRLLGRLKLTLFAVTIILFIHALPGRYVQEAFPLTRWAMFSEDHEYPSGLLIEYRLRITTTDGQTITTDTLRLYSNLVGNPFNVGTGIALKAVTSEDSVSQHEYQQALVNHITARYGVIPAAVEVWQLKHVIDLTRLPHVDSDAPVEQELVGTFTVGEQTE